MLKLPDDILLIIAKYASEYTLLDWISLEKLDWEALSANSKAIDLILKNRNKIDWVNFVKNPHPRAVTLIEKNICFVDDFRLENKDVCHGSKYLLSLCENTNSRIMNFIEKFLETKTLTKFQWNNLSRNTGAMRIIEKEIEKRTDNVHWGYLERNPAAVYLLEKYPENVDKWQLAFNPKGLHLFENFNNVDWRFLSANPAALCFLLENLDKIKWHHFSMNTHPIAIEMLEGNLKKVHWGFLSENPAAINILEKNQNKIGYKNLSGNPSIFEDIEENTIKIYSLLKEIKN